MHGRQSVEGDDVPVDALPLDAFRPDGVDRLYLLGGAADVSRARAERLLRPLELIDLGARIGAAAAREAAAAGMLSGVHLPGEAAPATAVAGDVGELLTGVRPIQQLPTIAQQARNLPVLGRYDVVVIGGGTGGRAGGHRRGPRGRQGAGGRVPAHAGRRRNGRLHQQLSSWGNRSGFTSTVPGERRWWPEQRAEWWRRTLRDEGADIWFGTSVAARWSTATASSAPWWPRPRDAASCWPTW
jgi:hypothetical protein